jgi:uncharacterized protein YbjQ (UPF0145 family)
MKKINIIMLVVLASFFLSSCTGNAVYIKNTKTFTATDPKTIQVYSSMNPSVNFEVVGYVSTYTSDADRSGDLLKNNLRIQAAQYGANAIIGFKLNTAISGGGGAQGVAVRYLQ